MEPDDQIMEGPGEHRVAEAAERIVAEGRPRLHRTWATLVATALLGGIDVSVGVMTLLFVKHETGSDLLAGLAFSVGLIALLLGHSELFTEGFLVPVSTVIAGAATWLDLLRLWLTVLVMNLVGGWAFMWIVTEAFPDLHSTAAEAGTRFVDGGYTLGTFCLSVLGGVITLMTRMHHGTESMTGKITASVSAAFILAGLGLWHSVLDSLIAFAGLHAGGTPYGYADWLAWLGWAVLGNVVGGLLLTTSCASSAAHRSCARRHRDGRRRRLTAEGPGSAVLRQPQQIGEGASACTRSSYVPCSVMRPCSRTTMWSAIFVFSSRWVTTMVMRSPAIALIRSKMPCSPRGSIWDVGSSRISSGGRRYSAREQARRCHWPPDSSAPPRSPARAACRAPRTVRPRRPHPDRVDRLPPRRRPRPAAARASRSPHPQRPLAKICGTRPVLRHTDAGSAPARSTPSQVTRPCPPDRCR